MDDQTISRKLALAIGYLPEHVRAVDDETEGPIVQVLCTVGAFRYWRTFDYKDWNVIAPIAERRNLFPQKGQYGLWVVGKYPYYEVEFSPQKAVALAVIAAHERGLLK